MVELTNRVFHFFEKDFKKRFICFVSIPLILTALFYLDCNYMPTLKINDRISSISLIKVSQSAGGTSSFKSKIVGYKYTTENNNNFSSMSRRIEEPDIVLEISPVFKSVKKVIIANGKEIEISSGLSGISLVLSISCNLSVLLSIGYILLTKEITRNAKLNLVFLNIFMFLIWITVIVKFGF